MSKLAPTPVVITTVPPTGIALVKVMGLDSSRRPPPPGVAGVQVMDHTPDAQAGLAGVAPQRDPDAVSVWLMPEAMVPVPTAGLVAGLSIWGV